MKCEKCGKDMSEIGPFARVIREGQPAQRFDAVRKYNCKNEECENYAKVIVIMPS